MPRGQIALQPLEHAPALDVGQENVERHGVRLMSLGLAWRLLASPGMRGVRPVVWLAIAILGATGGAAQDTEPPAWPVAVEDVVELRAEIERLRARLERFEGGQAAAPRALHTFALPERLDGQSLMPLLRGEQAATRPTLFLAYSDVQRAVRDRRFKLIRYPQVDVTQLFDLENDPQETRNLAGEPAYGDQVRELRRALSSWQEALGDNTSWRAENRRSPTWTPPTR